MMENSAQKTIPLQQPTAQGQVSNDAIGSGRGVPLYEAVKLQSVFMLVGYCLAWGNPVNGTNEVLKVEFQRPGFSADSQTIPQPGDGHHLAHSGGATGCEIFPAFAECWHHSSAAVIHNHTRTAEFSAHYGQTVSHGFQNHQPARVPQAGEQEHISIAVMIFHAAPRDAANPFDNF